MAHLPSNVISCHFNNKTSCENCRLNQLCLPISLQINEIDKLDAIIKRKRPIGKGDAVFHLGERFSAIYAVRSGSLKTVNVTVDGQEQVTGFYLPGEIFGLDGLGNNIHTNSAVALETSAICEIPFSRLEELTIKIPSLQRHIFQVLGQEIASEQSLITHLSTSTAEERVAALLISISSRNHRRQLSGTDFRLPMSRTDMASYLGVTIETVSRILSHFQKKKLVTIKMKDIIITDMQALRSLAKVS
ncbi:fumarate/nitrate reduction transcriptional regulator Fnr [Alteromonas sp. 5E99-2]|uniref:fumarate/nitrate reduction transcriptional regulator Fnr n=1 Tax=Alteromonas sp. 5E99-2 TaxID=2817683 RepID=UPI001A989681|nr:fumarate/nitrate reduction transcriptional regulator Fnr [Alteromonas sp. 5E99-2]MBO1254629.1 fumarate/nitrate reduction transcriptional regulator Fnr [Alteromonas sp. 5E99-2]